MLFSLNSRREHYFYDATFDYKDLVFYSYSIKWICTENKKYICPPGVDSQAQQFFILIRYSHILNPNQFLE